MRRVHSPNEPTTRRTGRNDCNRDAHTVFAAALGAHRLDQALREFPSDETEDLADGERKIEAYLTDLAVNGKVSHRGNETFVLQHRTSNIEHRTSNLEP